MFFSAHKAYARSRDAITVTTYTHGPHDHGLSAAVACDAKGTDAHLMVDKSAWVRFWREKQLKSCIPNSFRSDRIQSGQKAGSEGSQKFSPGGSRQELLLCPHRPRPRLVARLPRRSIGMRSLQFRQDLHCTMATDCPWVNSNEMDLEPRQCARLHRRLGASPCIRHQLHWR